MCGSKNGYQKNCLKEIGRHAQKLLIFLDSLMTQHIWRYFYDHLMRKKIFDLIRSKIFIQAQKKWRKWLWARFGFANHLALIALLTAYKKWVQIKEWPFKTQLSYCTQAYLSNKERLDILHVGNLRKILKII